MNQRGFILPGLPNPYFLLAAGIAIAVSFGAGYWRGWSSGMEKYYEFEGRVKAENEQIRIDNERKLAAMGLVQRRTEDGWRTALAELQRNRIRVQPIRCQGAVPGVPAPAGRPDEAAAELRPDPAISITVDQCEARVNAAANDAAQVVWIQQWIKDRHEASK